MQQLFGIYAALIAWGLSGTALATPIPTPVALIVDISGVPGTAVEPFTEMDAGGKIDLGTKGRLEFLDYNSCKNVIIVGGRVSFTERRYMLRGGRVEAETRANCPRVVTLNKDARVGGILLRSSQTALRLSARPQFAFTGRNAAIAAQVRIIRQGAAGETYAIKNRQLRWPANSDGLSEGHYEMEVLSTDGYGSKRLRFEVTAARKTSKMTIIRLD